MALSERLELLITANGAAAVREFGKVGAAAEKELKKTQTSLDKTASTMTSVGTKAIGVGVILTAAFIGAAKAADESAIATAKMNNSIANSPALAGESVDKFQDLATALQKTTVATDEQVLSAEALLAQFGLTADEITGLTPLVVDLSRKMGIDMESAAKMVGKAMDGSSGALKKAGIVIDENALKTDAYAAVTDGLRRTVGGFAEQEGKTFNGQLTIMKNNLGEISEGVGRGAIEAFNTMLGPVKSLSSAFQELDPATQSLVGQVGTFGAVGLIAAGVTSTLIGQAIKMRDNFGLAAEKAKLMWTSLKANPAAIAGIAAAAGAVYLLTQRLADNQKQADKYVKTQLEGSRSDEERIDKLKQLKTELEAQQGPSQDLFGAHLYLTEAGRKHADQLDAVNKELEQYETKTAGATKETSSYTEAMDNLNTQLKALFDPQFAVIDAQQRLNELMASGTATAEELAKAQIDVEAATQTLAAGMRDGSVSIEQTKQKLDQWVQAGILTSAQAQDLANKLYNVSAAANDLDGRKVLITLISQWREEGVRPGAINAELNGRAQGGPVHRGQSYIVGDRRGMDTAEVFTPNADGYITPSMHGGSSAPGNTYVYVGGEQVAAVVTSRQRYEARGRRG